MSKNVCSIKIYHLGEANVEWKGCIDNPETWHVNHEFNLTNIAYVGKETKKVGGILGVQTKWIPSSSSKNEFILFTYFL